MKCEPELRFTQPGHSSGQSGPDRYPIWQIFKIMMDVRKFSETSDFR